MAAALTGILNWICKIPSLILTMALTMIFEIMGKNISGKFSFVSIDYKYAALGSAPYIIIVLFVSAVVFYFIFNHTKFSYHMRAVGSNEAVSRNAGIHVQRVKVLCFVIGKSVCRSIGSADDQPVRLYGGTDESWECGAFIQAFDGNYHRGGSSAGV